jgi:hypothetical protein
MPRYCPRCGESLHGEGTTKGETRKTARRAYEKSPAPGKKKRGPSAYNLKYKAEYARQKKKHPRSKMPALSKKSHAALRRKK